MELFWWFFTIALFAVGLIGTVLPILPGTTIILAAVIIHRIMLGADKSVGWKAIVVLILLTLLSYVFDFLGSYFGAKYFGATRWGALGAIAGALVGLFFGIIGLFCRSGDRRGRRRIHRRQTNDRRWSRWLGEFTRKPRRANR